MPAMPARTVAPGTGAVDDLRALVRQGRVRLALSMLRALEAEDVAPAADRTAARTLLLECHLAQGDLDAARALAPAVALDDRAEARHALAELAAATLDPDVAVERYLAVAEAPGADPEALRVPWRTGAALAMLRAGRRAEAFALARTQHATTLAHGSPADLALALRVLATTKPDGLRAPDLRVALALLDGVEAGRLRAQLQTDLAGLLLLVGEPDEALVLLRSAEEYAAAEDLWPLLSRGRRLLERMGEAPRRRQSEVLAVLTAGERRVALLALEGRSNRSVAEQLGVSVKAVEGHLSKIYRKLDVTSRPTLVASFAASV
ncbi:hypothetical protein FE634_20585 [Nocardioides dongxiaopingii]|uniref:helix-turn-helix transcriptional regulator n=1 Tax=Nocardioides sp. S-1144 TaxID=2582905 RepID=UPI00110D7B8E|nr:LuxR C-terminal-related transcriptional regulator [Nocardioides sp. S-1144]QCW52222.1 hypothetical protein FE634_20585 [Nocardioides sp. S-1144]